MTQKIKNREDAIAFLRQNNPIAVPDAISAVTDDIFALLLKEHYLVPSANESLLLFSEDGLVHHEMEYRLKLEEIRLKITTIKWQAKENIVASKTRQVEIKAGRAIQIRQIEVEGQIRMQESYERIQIAAERNRLDEQQMYLNAVVQSIPAIAQIAQVTVPLFVAPRNITQ